MLDRQSSLQSTPSSVLKPFSTEPSSLVLLKPPLKFFVDQDQEIFLRSRGQLAQSQHGDGFLMLLCIFNGSKFHSVRSGLATPHRAGFTHQTDCSIFQLILHFP